MTLTASMPALLHVALQDLHAGKRLLAERLPALATAARDSALRERIAAEAASAARQADRLAASIDVAGPDNLWMAGILDDADRDARSHQPGPILDVALTGAVRKAMAAQIVSEETAIALARVADQPSLAALAEDHRRAAIDADRALAAVLAALTR